ncbi:putative NADH-ubiquinone oxidoreductase 40 kDa subunit, mitochondrial [Glarea lozoyensis 74030]|uniref:Putative NADH-ubiquinone oxidoreductase 40 kDa subunit, mitochondrial n=1 Tax=Glarea lozoyensis (strain ATCC 74030 / MF5533) TaxID=1104152 RepID=H0EL97_GLAL7|nr:putative NADH-ubiquinone oxidoreductase 40 kDa subunit, mitochondrial [Glarea lozoyensis 74030]
MQKSCGASTMNGLRTAARLKTGAVANANAIPRRHISDISITRTGKATNYTNARWKIVSWRNFTLEDVHVEGVERIAEVVAKYDVDRFIHVSSHNADLNSPSEFFRTKERFNPVHAIDVGKALEKMIQDDSTAQQTYELYGPTNYSTAEIAELVDKEIIKRRRHINVPKKVLQPIAKILNQALWWPTTSADEIEREFIDQKIDPSAKTFADLGIEPAELASLTFHYLQGYRSASFNDLPPATEREKREEKKYLHVLDDQ